MSPGDREALPFLPGNSALIERVARLHHAAVNDPLVAFLRPQVLGEMSFSDCLDVGREALRRVGIEIGAAKTAAEAASATLRRDAHLASMERIEQHMLRTAMHHLSAGALVAYGRRTVGGKLEPIPRAHWEAGDADWLSHRLVAGVTRWHGVRILDMTDLAEGTAAAVAADITEKAPDVNPAALHVFLAVYVNDLRAGDPGLAELKIWTAAMAQFPDHRVARERVREWMRDKMDPTKRFERGRPR